MLIKDLGRETAEYLGLPAAIFLIVFVGGLWLLVPKTRETFHLRKENIVQMKKAQAMEAKAETLEQLSVSGLKEKLEFVFKILPAKDDPSLLLTTIEQMVFRNSLRLIKISGSVGESGEGSFACTIIGEEKNLNAFFKELDKTLPLMSVSHLTLRWSDPRSVADFTLTTHSLALSEKIKPSEKVRLLGKKEEEILEELKDYTSAQGPSFELEPSGGGRDNPFFF